MLLRKTYSNIVLTMRKQRPAASRPMLTNLDSQNGIFQNYQPFRRAM